MRLPSVPDNMLARLKRGPPQSTFSTSSWHLLDNLPVEDLRKAVQTVSSASTSSLYKRASREDAPGEGGRGGESFTYSFAL